MESRRYWLDSTGGRSTGSQQGQAGLDIVQALEKADMRVG